MFSSEARRTLTFTFVLCFVCALLLATLANLLEAPQKRAKEVDQSQQMLLAAQILDYNGSFQLSGMPARFENGKLIPTDRPIKASQSDILNAYAALIHPMLTNEKGDLISFANAGIEYTRYLEENRKKGYANLPLKLLYVIGENEGYVIPINGYGLWDAIYGYIALAADGDTVLGVTWYSQAETAGLGAVIAEPSWQKQFKGKLVFQPSADGSTNFTRAPLGITVIKGKVSEVLGTTPKARSSVDGISGATLTGTGVTNAYEDSLAPYRPFLIRVQSK